MLPMSLTYRAEAIHLYFATTRKQINMSKYISLMNIPVKRILNLFILNIIHCPKVNMLHITLLWIAYGLQYTLFYKNEIYEKVILKIPKD